MDQVRLKIASQSNGNHIQNTLSFLYWLSGGTILYLLRNSSETRDKCKLKLFQLFFVKPCTTPKFSLISFLTSFLFKSKNPPPTCRPLLCSYPYFPSFFFPSIPSYFLLPYSFQIREQAKKWENSSVPSSLSISSAKKSEKRNAFFLTA